MVRQAEAFHTPFPRKFSGNIFLQTKVKERGRHESQEVVDVNQEGNKICDIDLVSSQARSEQEDRGFP